MSLHHVIKDIKTFFSVGKMRRKIAYDQYKLMLDNDVINNTAQGVTSERHCGHEIVVSLTTYEPRLRTVYLTIASLMHQSLKANHIVLWLADEYRNRRLPATLTALQKRGLEIQFCPDIRSYKKLIPTLELYPDAAIITVDDDVIYDFDLIDRLVSAHIEDPDSVLCTRMKVIQKDASGEILPYKKWKQGGVGTDNPGNFATGVGGILYPPHIFTQEMLDKKKFMTLAPTADDIWFKAMTLSAGVKVRRIITRNDNGEDFLQIPGIYSIGLAIENVDKCRNDATMKALEQYFRSI